MKTPDEIKKGLECCATVKVGGVCPFDCPLQPLCGSGDDGAVQREILALIQQLQAQNAEQAERIRVLESRNNALYHTIIGVMHFVDKWLDCPAYDPDEDLQGTAAVTRAAHAREIALQAIEQLEDRVPRWISVEEMMPEHMDDVLVWVGGLVEVGCYDESNECWELYTYVGDGSVTHWMHLPEPPKEAAT